jgi:biotin-dependent carboxylase-like uncharacterized protein
MSRLVITAASPGTSVQDAGRFGAQRYGLVPSGAVDRLALAAANALVGNALFAAAVEIGPLNTSFTARGGAVRVALTGATRPADIAGEPVALNHAVTLAEGQTLSLGVARGGVFSYLAIEGGVPGEPMFGSLSVNARAGLGSPFSRALQPGDELSVAYASDIGTRRIDLPTTPPDQPIRVVLGPQDDEFDDAAQALFLGSDWKISATSDRMGYRLEGPVIKHLHGNNIVSDGTVTGSIQVPGSGAPIVLMHDRGTTGGYPKIATVISADLGRFGQTQAGVTFRFRAVSMAMAQAEARAFAELLRSLPDRVHDPEETPIDLVALASANVAGMAVSAIDSTTWQVQLASDSTISEAGVTA